MTPEAGAAGARSPEPLAVVDLGRRRPYGPVWDLQKALVRRRQVGAVGDTFLLVEHTPVYTLGRHGNPQNLLWDARQRGEHGIEVFHIDRGGDVTYHGPGQIVGYPIVDLRSLGFGVREYVRRLEQGLIAACRAFGVEAAAVEGLPGVWVADRKIAAIGIRCSRGVTSHGFAFNVSTDLRHFDGIIPCGLTGRGVTSLERELGAPVAWRECLEIVADRVAAALGYARWTWVPPSAAEQVAQEEAQVGRSLG